MKSNILAFMNSKIDNSHLKNNQDEATLNNKELDTLFNICNKYI